MTKSVTPGEGKTAAEPFGSAIGGAELFQIIATAADQRFATDESLGDSQRRKLLVALLHQVARHARDCGIAALTTTDAGLRAFSLKKWKSGETRVRPSGRGPLTQKLDRVVGHWMRAIAREPRSSTAVTTWTGIVPSVEGNQRFSVTFHFNYPRRKTSGRQLAITATIARLVRSGDYDRPVPVSCSSDTSSPNIHLPESTSDTPVFLGRIMAWLAERYAALPPDRRAEVDEKSNKGPLGIIGAISILAFGCALAYYVASRDLNVFGRVIKTPNTKVVTVLRWQVPFGLTPPYEIFRDGRLIGHTSNTYFVDEHSDKPDATAIPPNHLYRVAARWGHLIHKTSAVAIVDNLVRPILPCTDEISVGLCWPRFTVDGMLSQSFAEFTTPLERVAMVGVPFRLSFTNLPSQFDGERIEIIGDSVAPHSWNLDPADSGGVIAGTMIFNRPGRTHASLRTVTLDGREVLIAGPSVNVVSDASIMLWGVGKPVDFPASDAHLLTFEFANGPSRMPQVVAARPLPRDPLVVDFGVSLPQHSPYMPLLSHGDTDREYEMAAVDSTQFRIEPRTIKNIFWVRHRYAKPGTYSVRLRGRRLIEDRVQLATLALPVRIQIASK